ncbi:efflux RND transporter periplasmic adaptor subunit [Desulforhopalus sp. IMCC35007]|uniref:efflux RND transporter periplasmic adaptor subunit n=1 Tax=Desulforhopalus sp. IMCC35007 TaxID=2569543 RepID=UPI0010ADDB2D|nr:efflux RND transporter periplasmic adaptor subunit [Desulforhopalus sp. IMCC35007]TKB11842.1 efflux RND transporter periplasmic adaptor subunit [Desulforhopalus sp. IMCC35007]
MTNRKIFFIFFILVFLVWYGNGLALEEKAPLDGITKPVADIELSFVQPGKIKHISVAKGDFVEAGNVLVTLEDDIEQIQKKILTGRSENRVPIELAEVELTQKKKNLENLKGAQLKGATSQWEVDHAALAVDTAFLTLKVREFEHSQDVLKLESVLEMIERLTLKSPVKGIVEDILVERGETVQAMVPVIRLVETDPLIIDLPVPVEQAVGLQIGQTGTVRFPDNAELEGTVIHISSVADAAATTLSVTLRVVNSDHRPAGERVSVVFM